MKVEGKLIKIIKTNVDRDMGGQCADQIRKK